MKHNNNNTIFALSTPKGSGAIGIIRISGDNLHNIISHYFPKLNNIKNRYAHYTDLIIDNKIIDKVVVIFFKSPNSYTGEDILEINIHNSNFIIKTIYSSFINFGLNIAKPGEFTKRALLNGKLNFQEAESVNSLINSNNSITHEKYLKILLGETNNDELIDLKNSILELYYKYSASIDFVEHDNDYIENEKFLELINKLISSVEKHIKYVEKLNQLDNGINLILVGIPNSGKSSIFNLLLQSNRAIVHNQEGTTRDFVNDSFFIDNFKLNIYDTAGIRDNADYIENEGIKRTFKLIDDNYYIVQIIDSQKDINFQKYILNKYFNNKKILYIYNKDYDNVSHETSISTLNDDSRNIIINIIKNKVLSDFINLDDDLLTFNNRHLNLLKNIKKSLNTIKSQIINNESFDLIYFELQDLLTLFDDLYGTVDSEDVLDKIFGEFCIGK